MLIVEGDWRNVLVYNGLASRLLIWGSRYSAIPAVRHRAQLFRWDMENMHVEVTEDSHPCSSERAATESMLEVLTSQGSRIVHHAHQSMKTYLKVCNSKAEVLLRIGKFSSLTFLRYGCPVSENDSKLLVCLSWILVQETKRRKNLPCKGE